MQENRVEAYITITSVKTPVATGTNSSGGMPQYNLGVTAKTNCGPKRDPNTNQFSDEIRELDVLFTGVTGKQIDFLAVGSQLLINGCAISYEASIQYPSVLFNVLIDNPSDLQYVDREALKDAVRGGRQSTPELERVLDILIPKSKRATFIRVPSGQFSLKATPKQLETAQIYTLDSLVSDELH